MNLKISNCETAVEVLSWRMNWNVNVILFLKTIQVFSLVSQQGKVKFMVENRSGTPLEPSPNYDCHLLKTSNIDMSAASPQYVYECTQVCCSFSLIIAIALQIQNDCCQVFKGSKPFACRFIDIELEAFKFAIL